MALELDFRPLSSGCGDAGEFVAAMTAEMRFLYDGLDLDAPGMPKAGPTELDPGGTYLVGYDADGRAVCGGGIKRLGDGTCEIKRDVRSPGLPADRQFQ